MYTYPASANRRNGSAFKEAQKRDAAYEPALTNFEFLAHEMVTTAQFLLKHSEIADEIAKRGFAWYREHYAGPSFWREVEKALW